MHGFLVQFWAVVTVGSAPVATKSTSYECPPNPCQFKPYWMRTSVMWKQFTGRCCALPTCSQDLSIVLIILVIMIILIIIFLLKFIFMVISKFKNKPENQDLKAQGKTWITLRLLPRATIWQRDRRGASKITSSPASPLSVSSWGTCQYEI